MKDGVGVMHWSKVGRELQSSLLPVGGNELGQPGLVHRNIVLIERRNLAGVAVDTVIVNNLRDTLPFSIIDIKRLG
jgi:hypothetical protein